MSSTCRIRDGDYCTGNRKPVHLISQALQVWSERVMPRGGDRPLQRELCQRLHELLKDALLVRNLVFHSLIGYSAQPPYQTQEAHLLVAIGEDPQARLADTLARLPDHKITKIDDLLP